MATHSRGEQILAAAGVGLAACAAAFAFVMVERGERSLFWAPVSPYIDSLAVGSPGPGLDAEAIVTGSIDASGARPAGPVAAAAYFEAPLSDYVVRDVRNGVALLLSSRGYRSVRAGDVLPGAGRVERIEDRDGRLIVVTSDGIIDERRD
jgi:hypothetical protein